MKLDSCPASVANARAEKGGMVAGSGALELLELVPLLVAVGRWQDFSLACRSRCGCRHASGTFLAIIIPTSISSYRAHDAPAAVFHFALA
jgi:hypothetical protein